MIARTHYLCEICNTAGRACGDDHMTRAPISSTTIKGDSAVSEQLELKEYEYMVGHTPVTAMLTAKQAERLKAKPVGEAESPGTGNVVNNEAERTATQSREAEDSGVKATHSDGTTSESAAEKTRVARNKRSQ